MLIGGTVRSGDNTPSNASVVATLPTLTEIVPFDIRDGQFIDGTTILNTAVVGAQLSIDLFGTEHSIGQTFTVNGQTFTVIGVLKPINNPINYNNIDFDHAAIISLESGKTLNHGVAQLQQINVKAPSKDTLATTTKDVANLLTERHGGEKDYSILSGDELSQPSSEFFYILAATLSAIAAISLVVGGIGIMNIMLVSVAERTREIGIRKALGASNAHITWQFLIESMVISLGGGLAGYVLGYGVGFVISRSLLTFDPLFNWHIALATLCISVLVGLLFGLYPALRAARKNPIEALRQYH